LIDFQASQFGTRDNVSFTINLGVVFSEISGLEGRTATLGRAHVRQRIGPLLGHRQDKWWDLDAGSDYAAVAADIAAALRSTAIPWLEGAHHAYPGACRVRSDLTGFLESWHLGGQDTAAAPIRLPHECPAGSKGSPGCLGFRGPISLDTPIRTLAPDGVATSATPSIGSAGAGRREGSANIGWVLSRVREIDEAGSRDPWLSELGRHGLVAGSHSEQS
jgi:hypothetical protein